MDSLPNLSTVIHKETKQIREEAARKEENDTTVSYRERAPPKKAIRRPMLEQKSSSTPHVYVYTCGPSWTMLVGIFYQRLSWYTFTVHYPRTELLCSGVCPCKWWVDSSSSSTTSLYNCIRFWYSSSFITLKWEKNQRGCFGILRDIHRESNLRVTDRHILKQPILTISSPLSC